MKKILICFIALAFLLGQVARIQQGTIGVTLLDLVVILVSVSWIFWSFIFKRKAIHLKSKEKYLFGFLVSGLIGLLLFLPILNPFQFIVSLLYPLRLILYLVIFYQVASLSTDYKKFVQVIMTGVGCLISILGLIQYFYYPVLKNLYYLGWDDHLYRLFSVFLDPNFAGAYFSIFIIFTLELLLTANRLYVKALYVALIGLSFVSLLLTHSRTGFIMLLVGVGLYLLSYVGKKTTGIVLLLCVVLFLAASNTRIEGLNPFRIASSEARLSSAHEAVEIILKHPLFGVGYNTYRYAQIKQGYRVDNPRFPSHADAGTDNSFLFVLATTGILGFGFFTIFWINILVQLKKESNEKVSFARSLYASLWSILVGSLFLNVMFYPMIILWIVSLAGLTRNKKL